MASINEGADSFTRVLGGGLLRRVRSNGAPGAKRQCCENKPDRSDDQSPIYLVTTHAQHPTDYSTTYRTKYCPYHCSTQRHSSKQKPPCNWE